MNPITANNSITLIFAGDFVELCKKENGSRCFNDYCLNAITENKRYWLKFPDNVLDVSTSFAYGFIDALWRATGNVDYNKYFDLFHQNPNVLVGITDAFNVAKTRKECEIRMGNECKHIQSFYIASENSSGIKCSTKEAFLQYLSEEIDRVDKEGKFINFDILLMPNNEE